MFRAKYPNSRTLLQMLDSLSSTLREHLRMRGNWVVAVGGPLLTSCCCCAAWVCSALALRSKEFVFLLFEPLLLFFPNAWTCVAPSHCCRFCPSRLDRAYVSHSRARGRSPFAYHFPSCLQFHLPSHSALPHLVQACYPRCWVELRPGFRGSSSHTRARGHHNP